MNMEFIGGMFVGVFVGVFAMALCSIGKEK
jgi:hypothetical protein